MMQRTNPKHPSSDRNCRITESIKRKQINAFPFVISFIKMNWFYSGQAYLDNKFEGILGRMRKKHRFRHEYYSQNYPLSLQIYLFRDFPCFTVKYDFIIFIFLPTEVINVERKFRVPFPWLRDFFLFPCNCQLNTSCFTYHTI